MAGQAAFDFVFKEMIPSATKKEKSLSHDEERDASTNKVSLKWRPAVSDLVETSNDKGSSQDGPSSSWSTLIAPASSKASVKVEIKNEKGEVQLALEDGSLALENHKTPETKETKDPKDTKKTKDPKDTKKTKDPKATKTNKSPKKADGKKSKKDKDEEKPKKDKAKNREDEGTSSKKFKAMDERKTFANRICPPGPEGSARWKAIQIAYNKVIKEKICKNKEVGFC